MKVVVSRSFPAEILHRDENLRLISLHWNREHTEHEHTGYTCGISHPWGIGCLPKDILKIVFAYTNVQYKKDALIDMVKIPNFKITDSEFMRNYRAIYDLVKRLRDPHEISLIVIIEEELYDVLNSKIIRKICCHVHGDHEFSEFSKYGDLDVYAYGSFDDLKKFEIRRCLSYGIREVFNEYIGARDVVNEKIITPQKFKWKLIKKQNPDIDRNPYDDE